MTPEEKDAIRKRASAMLSDEHDRECDGAILGGSCCGFDLAEDVIGVLMEVDRLERELAGVEDLKAMIYGVGATFTPRVD